MVNLKNIEDEKHKIAVGNYFSSKTEYWDVVYKGDYQIRETASHQKADMVLRQQISVKLVDEHAPLKSENLLDIGCGTGVLLEILARKGYLTSGIDISEGMINETSKRIKHNNLYNAHCYKSEVESMPFDNSEFDLITCLGVLEYLPNEEIALGEIKRVLKQKGILIISAPNLFKIKNVLDPYILVGKGYRYLTKKKNKKITREENLSALSTNENFANKRYTISKLKALFNKLGFEIVSVHSLGFGPFTLFNKKIMTTSASLNLNNIMNDVVAKNKNSILNYLPNRWVFCLKKI